MHSAVTETLGYDRSPSFVRSLSLEDRAFSGYSHVYRRAREFCGLQGVYLLEDPRAHHRGEVPVVFYCQAENEAAASRIHQRVWNQGVVPFLLVETPKALRLYSGFRFDPHADRDHERGVLMATISFNEVADRLAAFRAEAIDSGAIWDRWGQEADPRHRVEWALLGELEALGVELVKLGLQREQGHALIGKLVYLKYLRDRRILSDRKLAKWGLEEESIFGPAAKLSAFLEVNARLDRWLNGSIFTLPEGAIRAEHLQLVTSVFAGGTAQGQLALDLGIYDFSFIPIETLSVIYEQFLHAAEDGETSRGRRAGAYYTPIPLVNYMLGELEARRPLVEGMRVLDPSCGSGAFLVQCYRALIEKRLKKGRVRPVELRDLLTRHIFGVDRDSDACRVAEMSLILTLLDYTAPPDLESHPQFKLPVLGETNIFHADFFDPDSSWASKRSRLKVDWLVGNPPWREIKQGNDSDSHALDWMRSNAEDFPTGGNQVAEAFVWHTVPLLEPDAVAGLLLPAMTLFKLESTRFRARFFSAARIWAVANFANLAYVLFAGRSQAPALALFFEPRADTLANREEERILALGPFLINQPAGRTKSTRGNRKTWSVVVNGAEMRELRPSNITNGDFRPWKEAMWGSPRDTKLLKRVASRFPTLADFGKTFHLNIHEGFQLRKKGAGTEPLPELEGKAQVDFSKLKNCGRIFTFPPDAISLIPAEMANVRKRGGMKGLKVSEPPHILVDVSRRFAIYSDEFIAVPARQIGLQGSQDQAVLLKALSLYLSSDFCRYQQVFTTPQWGVGNSIATLKAFRSLPIPLDELSDAELREWGVLYDKLAAEAGKPPSKDSLKEVDERVYQLLGIGSTERILMEDFLQWHLQMVKGKVPPELIAPPAEHVLDAYLLILKNELDGFIGLDSSLNHEISLVRAEASAMLAISLAHGATGLPTVLDGEHETAKALETTRQHLLRRHSQWLYFERSLKIYQDGAMYVFKPLEAIHWTRRQAILDADEIIAETLGSHDG